MRVEKKVRQKADKLAASMVAHLGDQWDLLADWMVHPRVDLTVPQKEMMRAAMWVLKWAKQMAALMVDQLVF